MDLSTLNSWWETRGLWQDPDLERVKKSPLRYHPRPFSVADASINSVYTLRGPRRVGKTVSLKLLVAELIEKADWPAQSLLWTTFETMRDLGRAEEHLLALCSKHRPRLLIVDEVTALIGWQKVIKKLRDAGPLENMCIILTGSSAFDLKKGAERMAGRRGSVEQPDRVLLPMSYNDFAKQGNFPVSIEDYLDVGGFPFRVAEWVTCHQEKKPWHEASLQVFDDVIFYEINRRRLDRSIALELIGRMAQVGTQAISYESIAKPLSLTRDTAKKYLAALGYAFLLATVSTYDTSKARVAPKKDRKFIWCDPALGLMAEWLKVGPRVNEATRAEWVVGIELLRRHENRLWEGLSDPRQLFTWRSKAGNEVDFLHVDRVHNKRFPVEVKYQNKTSAWDAVVMQKAFGQGTLVTRQDSFVDHGVTATTLENFLAGA